MYKNSEGKRFIISYDTPVMLTEEGLITVYDCARLRLEKTVEKVYMFDTDEEVEAMKNALNDLSAEKQFEECKLVAEQSTEEQQL